VQRTYYPKPDELHREWYVVDAAGQNLGRLATRIAAVLLGKNKPTFTPGVDGGDFVIVVNAEKVAVTGKRLDQKVYYRISGYPGGIRRTGLREQLERHPDRVIRTAVQGMLPKNRYAHQVINKLKVYAGPEHPHSAQKPKPLS
jgi:large subunit ribosomal protein L13